MRVLLARLDELMKKMPNHIPLGFEEYGMEVIRA